MKLPINEIKPNKSNPRIIKDKQFQDLVQSLKDFPEMAEVREVVLNKDHVILGGNMRYQAAIKAGWTEIPVKIVDWPEDKQREFIIKDNNNAGEWDWDILANEWDAKQLEGWGTELPTNWQSEENDSDINNEISNEMSAIAIVAFDNIKDLDRITELYGLDSFDINDEIKSKIISQRKVYVFKE